MSESLVQIKNGILSGEIVISTQFNILEAFNVFLQLPALYSNATNQEVREFGALYQERRKAIQGITTAEGNPIFLEAKKLSKQEILRIAWI